MGAVHLKTIWKEVQATCENINRQKWKQKWKRK